MSPTNNQFSSPGKTSGINVLSIRPALPGRGSKAAPRCATFLCLAILGLATQLPAQWVGVDPAFPAGSGPDYLVRTMAVQPDGHVLIGGRFTNVSGAWHPYFARVSNNGTVDAAFVAQLNAEPTRIQPLADGRILISGGFTNVSGVFRPGFARLLPDGSVDTGFVPPNALGADKLLNGMAAPGGAVLVTGSFTNLGSLPRNHLARLLQNGSIDPAFWPPFAATNSVSILAVQPDGKPIVSGSFSNLAGLSVTNLVRLNGDGSVDVSFRSGLAPNERISQALLQPDGRLLAAVSVPSDFGLSLTPQRLVRLNANGSLDQTFNVAFEAPGFPWNGILYALALQADGKILASGTFLRVNGIPRAKIARLSPDGTVDYCFDLALGAELVPFAVAAGLDESVIVGGMFAGLHGQSHPNLLRLLPPPHCEPGIIEFAVATLSASEDAPRIVVPVVRHGGADLEQSVAFSTRDGSAQSGADYESVNGTLQFGRGERSQFISIPLLRDGDPESPETFELTLSQAGAGATLGSRTNATVTLTDSPLGTAGAPDTNYIVQLDGPVQAILPLADGRVAIAGAFTNVNGQLCPNLARLQADGARDPGFVRTQRLDGQVRSLALDSAGRLLVAGYFQRVDGAWRPGLARFDTDGALDPAFAPFDGWPTNYYGGAQMDSVAVLADGSIVCGGMVPESDYDSRDVLLKFSPAGEMDLAFASRMPPNALAYQLKSLSDGGFLQVGSGFGSSLAGLHPDGTINLEFILPADRQFTPYAGFLGLLADGRVAVAGGASAYYGLPHMPPLWRLNPDGSLDGGFSVSNSFGALGELQWVDALQVSADGRVLLAGGFSTSSSSTPTLRRLHADGSYDPGFDQGTGLKPTTSTGYAQVFALAPLLSGGWLLGGDFAGYDGFNQRHLLKLLPDALTRTLTFSFTITNLTIRETNASLTFEVRRRGDASGTASVTVRTRNGTATAGQDFQPLDTTLTFAPGEWSKTISLQLLNDPFIESTELFTVCLTNATAGFSLAQPSTVTVSIQNDDAGVEFAASEFHGLEEDGFVLATVKWSGTLSPSSQALVNIVPITGRNEDLGVSSVPVQYGVGSRYGTNWLRIPIVDNAQHDPTRQFRLELVGSDNVFAGPRTNASLFLEDLDFTTTPARGVAGVVEAIASSPEGGVYLAGDFTGVHGVPLNRMARLRSDGEVDARFNPGAGPNAYVSAVAVQPDGKILIAGSFTAVAGVPRAGIARLHENGSLDLSFAPGLGAQHTNGAPFIRVLLPQDDGSVFIAGSFTHFNSHYSRLLAHLASNGSVDSAFASPFSAGGTGGWPRPIVAASSALYALVPQPDGKLLAAGIMYYGTLLSEAAVVRINRNGQLDSAFTKGTASARSLALTAEGKILVGGTNTTTWLPIRRCGTNGAADALFQIRNAPSLSFNSSEIRQLQVQPDGRILFCAAIYSRNIVPPGWYVSILDRVVVGRLLPDGAWDSSFSPLTCALPLLQQPGPFWFNDPAALPSLWLQPPLPAVSLARQPDGVLVLAGAFDFVNGEPRRRLARVEPDGSLRGRLGLRLTGGAPLRLQLPGEVESPYVIETSCDLNHWSDWLLNNYPWWPVELWLAPNEPARFFRARPVP